MKKFLFVVAVLLLPTAVFAQGALRVSQVLGSVEWRAASSRTFVPLTSSGIGAGDEIRTGSGGSVILTAPDGSYMVVSENSKVVVDDFWSGDFKSLINLMIGQVRFYIQRFGGRPNPYSVRTPTALIAVRGTTFDVLVDDAQTVQVHCLEGRVTVENPGLSYREVILDQGFWTVVRPGEVPVTPVRTEAEINNLIAKSRTVAIHQKHVPDVNENGVPSLSGVAGNNDRNNRVTDPRVTNSSTTDSNTQRAKGTLSFPQ